MKVESLERVVHEQALEALGDEAIARARTVAPELVGVVITNDEEARRIVDLLAVVKDGRRAGKALLEGVTAPLRKAMEVVRAAFQNGIGDLDTAYVQGNAALDAWTAQEAVRLRREREALEAQARAAVAAQAAQGIQAPPMEVAMVQVPTLVKGTNAVSYQTSVVWVEVVDWHAVVSFDPSLVRLDEVAAKALFRAIEKEHPGTDGYGEGGVTLHGMRFWREQRRATR